MLRNPKEQPEASTRLDGIRVIRSKTHIHNTTLESKDSSGTHTHTHTHALSPRRRGFAKDFDSASVIQWM